MAEINAPIGPGAQGIHSPRPTGLSMGHFRYLMSMEEPLRNYISRIRFDIEAPEEPGRVNSVGGLAEAERIQVPTDRRVSIVALEDFSADSRGENLPTTQSTRLPLSLHGSLNNSELRENSMDLTGKTHISDSYIPNSMSEPAPANGQGSAAPGRTTPLRVPNVQGCNIGATRVAPSGSFAVTVARLPSVSAPSSSFNRIKPTGYLRPVSESERLLSSRISPLSVAL